MTFEYRDGDGETVIAQPLPEFPAIILRTSPNGAAIPAARVEELIAGIRDITRQAAGQPGPFLATPCAACTHPYNWHAGSARCQVSDGESQCGCAAFVDPAARQTTGQDHTEACRPVEVDGTTVLVRGNSNWTEQDQHFMAEVVQAAKRKYAAEHPPVGQPAEAQAADEAEAYQQAARRAHRRLAAVERLVSGRPGYHQITVKDLLAAMSDETVEDER